MPVFPENPTLAQSYVPYQFMNETYKPCVGLKMGTIFPELVSPYVPCQSIEEIEFIKATNKIGKGCNR
ncbi:MAG: spore coat associated protein CotJA [Clostridia bacterium]|nr:spore coat associated protein CotJA [Clostridia bacterium]